MRLSLNIDNKWCDVESDKTKNTLVLNYEFDSLTDPAKYFSEFSYTFKVPRTAKNDRIFNLQCRLDSVASGTVSLVKRYKYRLYGEKEECVSVGIAKITSWNKSEYVIQLNGSLGIAFQKLLNSGFDTNNDNPEYSLLPDYVNYDGLGDYTADLRINRFTVGCSWNVDSLLIPFTLSELRSDYGNLVNLYYLDQLQQYTEKHAWAASLVGFMPQTQGRVKNFENGKWTWNNYVYPLFQTAQQTAEIPVDDGLTEYQMSQFRSYYQTPFVYVQKLFEIYKENFQSITGYSLDLDERWYNEDNNDLRDCVYTLPNLGYNLPEKQDPASSSSETRTSNVTLPANAAFDDSTYKITNLRQNTNQYLYSGYFTVEKNQTFEAISEIPIKFTNPSNVFYVSYPVEQARPKIDKAYNNINPIIATWDIIDSNNNIVASSPRESLLVPLLQNNQFTEEWDHPLREQYQTIFDVICFYYQGEQIYDNRTEANFGTVQLAARWKNNSTQRLVRVRWHLRFTNDFCPLRTYLYATDEWGQILNASGYTGGGNDARITWATAWESQVNVYDPVRSDSKVTMERLFKSVQPFSILLKYSKMMNLVWQVDDNNQTVRVKRKYDFFKDCVETDSGHFSTVPYQGFLDITDKIDTNKDFTIEPLAFNGKSVTLGYKEDADNNVKRYKEKFTKNYGDLILYTADSTNKETIEVFNKDDNSTLYPPMVATDIVSPRDIVEQLQSAKYETFPFPSNITDSGETAGAYGIFYFRGASRPVPDDEFAHYKRGGTTPYVLITDDEPVEVADNVYCYHYDSGTSYALDKSSFPVFMEHNRDCTTSLFFGEPREMYYDVEQQALDTDISIYTKEWKRYLDDAFSVMNKQLTCYAYVSSEYYLRLKANPLVQIENCIYLVQKMEYSEENHYAKLVLRQIFSLDNLIADATRVASE